MVHPIYLLPCAIGDMFAQAYTSRQLTQADRYGLMAAMLDENLTDEEIQALDRLLHSLHRGRLQVSSEISAVIKD